MKISKISCQAIPLVKSKLLLFGILLSVVIILPGFVHHQWITGSVVNAVLILATVCIGPMEAMVLGMMPSTLALSSGLLPIPMAPMIPFIIIGNAVLIMSFQHFALKNFALRILVAAFIKFVFLFFSAGYLMEHFFGQELTAPLLQMMSWPQFLTALIGGLIVYPFFKAKNDEL